MGRVFELRDRDSGWTVSLAITDADMALSPHDASLRILQPAWTKLVSTIQNSAAYAQTIEHGQSKPYVGGFEVR